MPASSLSFERQTPNGDGTSPLGRWSGADSAVCRQVLEATERTLEGYRINPVWVEEHANNERHIAQGGYGRRQLYELVQNGADAMLGTEGGSIHVLLTDDCLYCANTGRTVDDAGVKAILNSHVSSKRGSEIGRFGLGFKSVLEISDGPYVFSRSGSFMFNAEMAASAVRTVVPDAERTPCLRTAWPVDPYGAAEADPDLADLMTWATTIIKVPRDRPHASWLSDDMAQFPAEFLLFSPHVGSLTLEDRTAGIRRGIAVQKRGDLTWISEEDRKELWQVFSTTHVPSEAARAEGGELADRESLPLMWAVPLQGRQTRGNFWAFFPTEYYTTLSGIINAPWKTNEDRQNLLNGDFNRELIDAAARLVANSLKHLVETEDPGRFLSLLPGRGREAPNWADEYLTSKVYAEAAQVASVPDQNGDLRLPAELSMAPMEMPEEARNLWASYPDRPRDWVHVSAERNNDRRSRVRRLLETVGNGPSDARTWLEVLADAGSNPAAASAAALRTAAAAAAGLPANALDPVRKAQIVLTSSGVLVPPVPGTVFIAPAHVRLEAGVVTVHPDLLAPDGVRESLASLGIGALDAASQLRAFIAGRKPASLTNADWQEFWTLARAVPAETAAPIIEDWCDEEVRLHVKVRTIQGGFLPLLTVLLPGAIVPDDGSRDGVLAIDVAFHDAESLLLRRLGAVEGPVRHGGLGTGLWEPFYRNFMLALYEAELPDGTIKPQFSLLDFERNQCAGPLDVLFHTKLSLQGKARFTEALLSVATEDSDWTVTHTTQPRRYPRKAVMPPSRWAARTVGVLTTSLGRRPAGDCVGSALGEWMDFFPVASCGREAQRLLGLPDTVEELTQRHWNAALTEARESTDEFLIGRFYAAAAPFNEAPDVLRCRVGADFDMRLPTQIVVTEDARTREELIHHGVPFIFAPGEADRKVLTERWELRPAVDVLQFELDVVPSGSAVPLHDRYLGLWERLGTGRDELQLIPCSAVREETVTANGRRGGDRDVAREGNLIYFSDRLDNAALLDRLTDLLRIGLTPEERKALLSRDAENRRVDRMRRVAEKPTPAERLLEAVGAAAVRRKLPRAVLTVASERFDEVDDVKAAELALAVWGVETLFVFREELTAADFSPPQQWAGSIPARRFVAALGFPKEYAGFGESRRPPVLEVDGPTALPPLHDFQEAAVAGIRALIRDRDKNRGLLSLPTGAGKTRITVEALVRAIKDDEIEGPVLWIAQSDELCEQAVQAWRQVWRAFGSADPLRICRLWAANEADVYEGGPQAVVATMQKLQVILEDPAYAWLSDAGCVVLDEAHHAVTPGYTEILHWQGFVRQASPSPLIGLTATPFRGGEDDTNRLASRFGYNRLDKGIFEGDAYGVLQRLGILAHVDHRILEGSDFVLRPEELELLRKTHLLPSSVEAAVGDDVRRNQILLNSILELPEDWPVLIFAASVDHAYALAALLNAEGVPSAAVSGATRIGARKHYVEQFRKGGLRVLTNYGVLTTGFDAPSVRSLYVARPTFSPVLYQQMIGRGLRGPLNGGKERCLIVNVADNFRQYGDQLAFRQFDYLWTPRSEQPSA